MGGAPRHLATASYPCSPWFERRLASPWLPKPLPTRFPMLTSIDLVHRFLPRLRNEPPQKRRAHFVECEWWCETDKSVGLLRERTCRWHQSCSFAPDGDFGMSVSRATTFYAT